MKWIPKTLGLPLFGQPLLGKELVEQAARGRTYILRVVYAAVLFFAFAVYFYSEVSRRGQNPFQLLGAGADMFRFLVNAQFIGIFLFLPAMMAGAITYEKERRSLELLFLTDLKPREILLQKYLSRLIPMFSFLLLSLPLMAVAYALGGISQDQVLAAVFLLVLACLQVGALALMVSSFCRTSAQAIVGTYAFGSFFYLFSPLLYLLFAILLFPFGRLPNIEHSLFFVPMYVYNAASRRSFAYTGAASIPIVFSTAVFLLLARAFLLRRAFVPAKHLTLKLFKWLDGVMKRANRIVGNVMLVKEKETLPENDPIAWRETAKKSLGKVHYLFRILVAVEVPVAFLSVIFLMQRRGTGSEAVSALVFIIWGISVLAITVVSANAVSSERANQTLEVLLTTPMWGRDIVLQKMRAVRRLFCVFLVPFFTLFLAEAWWEHDWGYRYGTGSYRLGTFGYLASSSLSVFILLPMYSWFAMWMGLRSRTRARAILGTLGVVVAWNVLPLAAAAAFAVFAEPRGDTFVYLTLFGPSTVTVLTEFGQAAGAFRPFRVPPAVPILLSYVWHAWLLTHFRRGCLKHADRYLGRVESDLRDAGGREKAESAPPGGASAPPG